jgi:death-on-curing protein
MKKTLHITLAEALELYGRLIHRFGGEPGVRDKGLLESALMRPRTGYCETLLQAAALMQSLAPNQAFIEAVIRQRVDLKKIAI